MAFNGGSCDTDGPHNKRLCTGQIASNDTNNNSNNNSLNNGNGMDLDKSGHIHLRVSFS